MDNQQNHRQLTRTEKPTTAELSKQLNRHPAIQAQLPVNRQNQERKVRQTSQGHK